MSEESERSGGAVWVRGGAVTVQAVLVVLIAFFAAAAIALPAQDLLFQFGVVVPETPEATATDSALGFLGFGVGAAIYLTATKNWGLLRGRVRPPTAWELVWIVAGVLVLLVSQTALSLLLSLVGIEIAQNQIVEAGERTPRLFLYMIPVTLLFVAPAEELLFRGIIQEQYREVVTPTTAIVVASVLFGVAHWLALLGTGQGRVAYILIVAVLGIILGYSYERTRNLVVPTLIHAGYNVVGHVFNYVTITGLV